MTDEFVTRREFDQLRTADQRALSIKESADQAALELAREHQRYRDEQANKLRDQINTERGDYVTQAEFKPVLVWMAAQQGRATLYAILMTLAGLTIAGLSLALVITR